MSTVSELVGFNLPQTEADLTADTGIDYTGIKASVIARAKLDVYGLTSAPAEADMPYLVLYQIADKATIFLIPSAEDYYKTKARMSDVKDGASFAYYDRIDTLKSLMMDLKTRIAGNASAVAGLVSGVKGVTLAASAGLPAVSGDGRHVTPDPQKIGRISKGVCPIV